MKNFYTNVVEFFGGKTHFLVVLVVCLATGGWVATWVVSAALAGFGPWLIFLASLPCIQAARSGAEDFAMTGGNVGGHHVD